MTTGGHVSAAEVARVERYLRHVGDLLGLGGWEIAVGAEPCEDGAHASIEPTEGKRSAVLNLCRDWSTLDPAQQRETLVHELLHLVHRDQTDLVRSALPESGYLPDAAYRLFWEAFRLATEVMVDQLARSIAYLMPELPAARTARRPRPEH